MVYVILTAVSVLLCVSVYFNWRFARTLLQIEDELEDCLETINEKYAKMTEILSRPLFFDSPEVRRVVQDVRDTRNALHRIAIAMSKNFKSEEDLQKGEDVRKEED